MPEIFRMQTIQAIKMRLSDLTITTKAMLERNVKALWITLPRFCRAVATAQLIGAVCHLGIELSAI
jgi:hypothetical protein